MYRTRLVRCIFVIAAVLTVLITGLGAGSALAEPAPADQGAPSGASSSTGGKHLPKGFPKDLRRLVAGTDEFKSGPWFTGSCSSKDGDIAAYMGEVFKNEAELMFWSLPEDARYQYLALRLQVVRGGGSTMARPVPIEGVGDVMPTKENVKKLVESGAIRPSDKNGMLAGAYPTTRSSEYPSTSPTCAKDIQKWTTKAMTTWGFEWAKKPDDESVQAMVAAAGDKGEQVQKRIDNPCEGEGAIWFCQHAYFLDCAKETDRTALTLCRQWNVNVGRLYAGTENWIDQNKNAADRVQEGLTKVWDSTGGVLASGVAKAFSWLWDSTVGPAVEFFKDAKELPEKWANYMKASAMDMLNKVLPSLASVGEFDLTQGWFLKWYAMSVGLGLAVMVAMFLFATASAARRGGADTLARDVIGYLPLGMVLMIYTPMLAGMLQAMMHALTAQIVELGGTTTDQLVENVSASLGALTNETLVGGVIMGIVGFGLMAFGMLALYLGMLMHQIGIPLACVGAAIAYGMLVFPKMRPKALRIPLMLLSLMASVPLLFIMLMVVFEGISAALANSTTGDGSIEGLGQLLLGAFGFFVIGVAPFALLKWAPMLPSEEDADRMGDAGSGSGQVVGGMGMGGSGVQHRMNSNASHTANSAASSAPGPQAGAAPSGGGGGGRHAASGAGMAKSGAGKVGKLATVAGGPVGGTAGRLAKVAGSAASGATKSAAGAGMRAGAMAAANRAHGVAADSAPSPSN